MLFLLYSYSLLYYTAYGVYKSYNEYFCLQKHPEFVSRSERFKSMASLQFWPYISEFDLGYLDLVNRNNKLMYRTHFNDTSEEFCEIQDKVKGINTGLKLSKPESGLGENITIFKYQKNEMYFTILCMIDQLKSNNSGFIDDEGLIVFLENYTKNNESTPGIKCMQLAKTSTCEIYKHNKDKAFKLFLYLIIPILLIFALFKVSFINSLNLRFKNDFIEYINECLTFKTNFCNPITGGYVSLKEGDFINSFSDGCLNLPELLQSTKFNYMKDLESIYFLEEERLNITNLKGLETIVLPISKIENLILGSYFFECTVNPKNCAVNNNMSHFFENQDGG